MRRFGLFLLSVGLAVLCAQAKGEKKAPCWMDPAVNRVNVEPSRAHFFAYESEELSRSAKKETSKRFMSIEGMWKFLWVKDHNNAPAGFYQTNYDDSRWVEFPVPGLFEIKGYGDRIYKKQADAEHEPQPDPQEPFPRKAPEIALPLSLYAVIEPEAGIEQEHRNDQLIQPAVDPKKQGVPRRFRQIQIAACMPEKHQQHKKALDRQNPLRLHMIRKESLRRSGAAALRQRYQQQCGDNQIQKNHHYSPIIIRYIYCIIRFPVCQSRVPAR